MNALAGKVQKQDRRDMHAHSDNHGHIIQQQYPYSKFSANWRATATYVKGWLLNNVHGLDMECISLSA